MTVEQLRSMGMTVQQLSEEEKHALDTVLEDSKEGQLAQQQLQMDAMASLVAQGAPVEQGAIIGGLPAPSLAASIPMGEGQVAGAPMPGMGPVITVRTDASAMMADGILPGPMGNGRAVRRNHFRYGGGGMMDSGMMNGGMMNIHRMDSMDSMDSMGPMMPRGSGFGSASPGPPAQHIAPVFVNKME